MEIQSILSRRAIKVLIAERYASKSFRTDSSCVKPCNGESSTGVESLLRVRVQR